MKVKHTKGLALEWEEYIAGAKNARGVIYCATFGGTDLEVLKSKAGFFCQESGVCDTCYKRVRGTFQTWKGAAEAGERKLIKDLLRESSIGPLLERYYGVQP